MLDATDLDRIREIVREEIKNSSSENKDPIVSQKGKKEVKEK